MTTQDFVQSKAYDEIDEIGLLFVDGYHSYEQARFDYCAFESRLEPRGLALFHDSLVSQQSVIYGPERVYDVRVKDYMAELKCDPGLQVFDLPFGTGVTLVRKLSSSSSEPLTEGLVGRP